MRATVDQAPLYGAVGRLAFTDALILALAWAGYVGLVLSVGPTVGAGVAAAAILPVALTGHRLGVAAGLAAGIAALVLNTALLQALGHTGIDVLLREGGGPGSVLIVIAGGVLGYIHRLDARSSRLASALGREQSELRKATVALRDELDHKAEYVSAIARELTNPLMGIQMAANILAGRARGELDPTTTLQRIADEAGLGLELVRSLDAAAAAETRRAKLRSDPMDIVGLMRETTGNFDARDHPLVVEAPHALATLADPEAVATILRHLLGNAAKYSPPRTPIHVSARTFTPGLVEIAVRDHGPGVPEAERDQLFRRFARLSTAGGTSGAGLGLYICEVIARELGGSMQFRAPSDGGAEFALLLRQA